MGAPRATLFMTGPATIGAPAVSAAYATVLWSGDNTSPRSISTIDLSGGGVVLLRRRNASDTPRMYLSANGSNVYGAETLAARATFSAPPITFGAGGFTLTDTTHNVTGGTYVAWCFKRVPRFCDVVTYTGDGSGARNIAHAVATVPSRLVVTRVDGTVNNSGAQIYDHHAGNTKSAAFYSDFGTANHWNNTTPTTTQFTVSSNAGSTEVNGNTIPYAAAVFAHDVAADGVIRVCSWVGNGTSSGPVISLGWQPQMIMGPKEYVGTASTSHIVLDTTRSAGFTGADHETYLGYNGVEAVYDQMALASGGFQPVSPVQEVNKNATTYTALVVKA